MNKMIKNMFIIFAITIVSGLLLGGVYQLTKDPIAQADTDAADAAYRQVFPDAAAFNDVDVAAEQAAVLNEAGLGGCEINTVLSAQDQSGSRLGYVCVVTSHEGYGGDIAIALGVRNDGTLINIALLEISETVGLGMNAEEVLVPQFADRKTERFDLSGAEAGQIDAISGATITSEAVVAAVNAGLAYFRAVLEV